VLVIPPDQPDRVGASNLDGAELASEAHVIAEARDHPDQIGHFQRVEPRLPVGVDDDADRSGDQRTRDGAELARAQLLVADGRGAEARPALKRLAASGATTAIKSRAADLLAQSK